MTIVQILSWFLPELSDTLATLSLWGTVALALATCFFGFRLRRAWYALLVFAVTAVLGYFVARAFLPERTGLCVLIALGAGLLVSLCTFRLYQAAVFVVAFWCVFGMVGEVLGDVQPVAAVIVSVVLGTMAGILCARFQRTAIILTTSISGGWRAASTLRRCFPALDAKTMLLLAAILLTAGAIFQFLTAPKK